MIFDRTADDRFEKLGYEKKWDKDGRVVYASEGEDTTHNITIVKDRGTTKFIVKSFIYYQDHGKGIKNASLSSKEIMAIGAKVKEMEVYA